MRRLWMPLGSVVAAVVVLFSTLQVVSQLAHEIEHVHETVPGDGVASLRIDLADGRVEVVGADVDEITIDAEVHHGLRRTGVRIERAGSEVLVRAGCPFPSSWCDAHPRVVVPRGLAVTIETGDGDIVVRDVDGAVDVATSNGGITLARLTGGVDATSGNGFIEATGLRSPTVTVATDNGSIDLDFGVSPSSVTALSHNGEVEVVVPDDAAEAYDVEVLTDNGLPDVAVRTDPSSDRSITVASGNGDLTVRYPTG